MAGKGTNGFQRPLLQSIPFREAPQQPGPMFMSVCDDPATVASLPTAPNGSVMRQRRRESPSRSWGVSPGEFLMYGMARLRSARRYGARNGALVEFPSSPSLFCQSRSPLQLLLTVHRAACEKGHNRTSFQIGPPR